MKLGKKSRSTCKEFPGRYPAPDGLERLLRKRLPRPGSNDWPRSSDIVHFNLSAPTLGMVSYVSGRSARSARVAFLLIPAEFARPVQSPSARISRMSKTTFLSQSGNRSAGEVQKLCGSCCRQHWQVVLVDGCRSRLRHVNSVLVPDRHDRGSVLTVQRTNGMLSILAM